MDFFLSLHRPSFYNLASRINPRKLSRLNYISIPQINHLLVPNHVENGWEQYLRCKTNEIELYYKGDISVLSSIKIIKSTKPNS